MDELHQASSDHDLLIELRTELKGLRNDIKELKDNNKTTLTDHENRLRSLERFKWQLVGVVVILELALAYGAHFFFK